MDRKRREIWCFAAVGVWLSTLALWIVLWFFNPYTTSGETMTVPGLVMILVAIFGVFASLRKSGIGQSIAALSSFIPIGLYLLGTPGIFAFIGVLNIMALVPAGYFLIFRHEREVGE